MPPSGSRLSGCRFYSYAPTHSFLLCNWHLGDGWDLHTWPYGLQRGCRANDDWRGLGFHWNSSDHRYDSFTSLLDLPPPCALVELCFPKTAVTMTHHRCYPSFSRYLGRLFRSSLERAYASQGTTSHPGSAVGLGCTHCQRPGRPSSRDARSGCTYTRHQMANSPSVRRSDDTRTLTPSACPLPDQRPGGPMPMQRRATRRGAP